MPNGNIPHYTVGEFSRRMQDVFRRVPQFTSLSVSGEISEVHPRNNGTYFTLKDAGGVLQCFAYPNRAAQFGPLPVGTAVIAFGTVRVASWRSRYELLVTIVQRTGIGELHLRYEALKEQFRALGFFERARKREIPPFPAVIALISARGKGAEDFHETLRMRAPQVRVEFFETRVQGLAADVEIAGAIDRASASGADAIVLARGGGSYEDLFTFNCEPVVRAIVRSSVPVITGIGHTADHHLADDAADYECETPSNAAQFIAGLWQRGGERLAHLTFLLDTEMRQRLTDALQRADRSVEGLEYALERNVASKRRRLDIAERAISAQHPSLRVQQRTQRLTELRTRLNGWPRAAFPEYLRRVERRNDRIAALRETVLSRRRNVLDLATSRLDSYDPRRPLELGYAIVTYKGRALRRATDVTVGDSVHARLAYGSLGARVESVQPDE
jgi:exodeoxyribonuclease VII large subunit